MKTTINFLMAVLISLGFAFTEKTVLKATLTGGSVFLASEYKSQSYLTKAQADTLYKPITYIPMMSTFGYSIGFDGSGVYYDAPIPDYRFNIYSIPLLSNVATSGNYNDLAFLPQIPNPGYGINTYGNQWNVDTLFFPKLSTFNSAVSSMTSTSTSKADKTTSITITSGTYTATKNISSNLTFTLPSFLTAEVDGSITNEIELPSQTSQSGKYLTTNGTSPSWTTVTSPITQTLTGANGISISSAANSFTVSKTKRQETYSGTTDASGNYTVTFGTAYSVAPNIQANPIGGTTEIFLKIVSVSTTGFTANVFQRVTVLSLALSTATTPVSGASVDVLITEK